MRLKARQKEVCDVVDLLNNSHRDILYRTLQVYSLRNEVIQNNIANVDTPDFKRSEVSFEGALTDALRRNRGSKNLDVNKVNPSVSVVEQNFTMRFDGNNVDIDAENLRLYLNSVRTDAIANSVQANNKIREMAVMGR